jgi:hypothetical protein
MGFATRIKATRICSADEDVRIGNGEIFNGRIDMVKYLPYCSCNLWHENS